MKKFVLILLLLAGGSFCSQAQLLSFKASSGDAEMDNILTDIHNKAVKDIGSFKTIVENTFHLAAAKIDQTLKLLAPGDLFMAAQLSSAINKPFDDVVKTYQANKSKGWGVIAKEMGIKPGSPEFHAMKKAMKANHGKTAANEGGASKGKGKGKKK
jgi:hypothetical protein